MKKVLIFTVNEIAKKLKTTGNVVRRLLRRGMLKGFKIGGALNDWKILSSDFENFIDREYKNTTRSFWDKRFKGNKSKK